MALNDPYARLFSIMSGYTPPGYSKIPTSGTSPYDFGLDPLNPYPTETPVTEDTGTETSSDEETSQESRSGGNNEDYVGTDRDYAYEPEYWGGYNDDSWAPDYGVGTGLKSLGYGKALGRALRGGGLIGALLGLGGNKLNPLNDPANIEGIKQAGTQFNFDPAMMETAIQNLYDGTSSTGTNTPGLLDNLFGGLFGEANPSKVNATDTLKGMIGMAGPWSDVTDWNQTNFTHYDPTSPNRLALGDVDAYRAAQMMDAYNDGFGATPSQYAIGMYQNLAMDPTLKPGWMNQYNDAITSGNPIGISGKIAARDAERNGLPGAPTGITLDSHEAGLVAGGVVNADGTIDKRGFQSSLDGWANGTISTEDMSKAFDGYKNTKEGLMSKVDRNNNEGGDGGGRSDGGKENSDSGGRNSSEGKDKSN